MDTHNYLKARFVASAEYVGQGWGGNAQFLGKLYIGEAFFLHDLKNSIFHLQMDLCVTKVRITFHKSKFTYLFVCNYKWNKSYTSVFM